MTSHLPLFGSASSEPFGAVPGTAPGVMPGTNPVPGTAVPGTNPGAPLGGEVLLFRVGGRTFASGVSSIQRIGTAADVSPEELVLETCLGAASGGARAIVVRDGSPLGETTLVVDEVLGFRTVPPEACQPLPALAAAVLPTRAVVGLLLVDGSTTLLVDLTTLVRERRDAAPA